MRIHYQTPLRNLTAPKGGTTCGIMIQAVEYTKLGMEKFRSTMRLQAQSALVEVTRRYGDPDRVRKRKGIGSRCQVGYDNRHTE